MKPRSRSAIVSQRGLGCNQCPRVCRVTDLVHCWMVCRRHDRAPAAMCFHDCRQRSGPSASGAAVIHPAWQVGYHCCASGRRGTRIAVLSRTGNPDFCTIALATCAYAATVDRTSPKNCSCRTNRSFSRSLVARRVVRAPMRHSGSAGRCLVSYSTPRIIRVFLDELGSEPQQQTHELRPGLAAGLGEQGFYLGIDRLD